MKEDSIYNALIVVSIIAIIAVIILIFTTKTNEPFTELYFEDHQNLPKEIELKKDYEFSFSIHNLENKAMNYVYSTAVEIDSIEYSLNINAAQLSHNQTITIPQSFQINKEFNNAKITVKLINKEQEIHFWVKQK